MLGACEYLDPAFSTVYATDITAPKLRAYASARLHDGASPATRRYELSIVRRALRLACQLGKLITVPVFPCVSVNNAREEYLTDQEFTALQLELPPYLRDVVAVMQYTGMRSQRELLTLE